MILENIWAVGSVFLFTILIFYIGSGKYLRPKIIFDTYTFFYIFIGSFFALHVLVFRMMSVGPDFLILFSLSTLIFSVTFLFVSYYYNLKAKSFIISIKNKCMSSNDYGFYKLFKINNFLVISLISLVVSLIVLQDNLHKFNTLTDLHGENAEYVLENYGSRLIVYLSSFLPFINLYFFSYLLFIKDKRKLKIILAYIFIILSLIISLTSNSRASVISLFLPLGLMSFYLYYFKTNVYNTISKLQIILALFAVSYAVYLGYLSNNDILLGASAIFVRLFMEADVALWYHLFGNLDVNMFQSYNITYFLHPILSPLGLSHIEAGLGPKIADLAGNKIFGKGPLPSYFYEAYLTTNSWLFVLFYSGFVGFLVPFMRYYSIKLFLKSNESYKYYFIAAFLYFINGRFLIDFLSFEIKAIISFIAILIFIMAIRLVFTKRKVLND